MGLRHEELNGMVLPVISVDEFEPKSGTNEEVIVVAFFVKDELPAYDLDEFIDKGVVEFLDSEVSPNPNDNGYYLVFVEFKRDESFWKKFGGLIKDIENVTGEMEWEIQPYLVDKVYDIQDPGLREVIITEPESYVAKGDYDATVDQFVEDSELLTFERDETHLRFGGANGTVLVEYVDFGNAQAIASRLRLDESYIDMSTSATQTALRLVLGRHWDITKINDYYFLSKGDTSQTLVVKGV